MGIIKKVGKYFFLFFVFFFLIYICSNFYYFNITIPCCTAGNITISRISLSDKAYNINEYKNISTYLTVIGVADLDGPNVTSLQISSSEINSTSPFVFYSTIQERIGNRL